MEYNKLKKIKIGDLVLFTEVFEDDENLCIGFIRQISTRKFTLNFSKCDKYNFFDKLFMEREIHFDMIKSYKILGVKE